MMNDNPAEQAGDLYAGLLAYLREVKADVVAKRSVDIDKACRLIRTLVDEPMRIQSIFPLTLKDSAETDYMVAHQANVSVFAMKLGLALKFGASQLFDLGVASLIHDLGIWGLPDAVLGKKDKLTESEREAVRGHSIMGRDLLAPFRPEHPSLAEVIYQHHERGNGTGYPRGLKIKDIHRHAILICFADAHEAMTHQRPHRRELKQTFTARELIADFREAAFPEDLVKAFLKEITPYPEGSYVRLNNQWICEVVAVNRENPLRPEVRVIMGRPGRGESGRIIRLSENPTYYIEDCLSPNEIRMD